MKQDVGGGGRGRWQKISTTELLKLLWNLTGFPVVKLGAVNRLSVFSFTLNNLQKYYRTIKYPGTEFKIWGY